jgi:hypothetical protein
VNRERAKASCHGMLRPGFQFKMTVMGELASSETVATRKRWPSGETMYWWR